jgi:Holliday junction DNA helicase RuvA
VIGRLTGLIVDQGLDGACILDVAGVGYEVHVPLGSLGRLAGAERVTLHVHTQLREDSLTLYGFSSPEDRAAFRTLISVTGIGPKLALGILSAMSATELADAINRGDRNRFKNVSGVGKKLVERLVLELKDKLPALGGPLTPQPARPAPLAVPSSKLGDVHGALVQMGFKPLEAEHAIARIEQAADGKPTEQLLREALSILA